MTEPTPTLDLGPLADVIAEKVAEAIGERPAVGPFLTVREAAEVLRCRPKRIYELVGAGRLRHSRDGRRLLFEHADLVAALEVIEPTHR